MTIYREKESEAKAVFLTFNEIRILLHSQGFHSCEGIYMPEKNYSAQEVLAAVHNLDKRGIIQIREGEDGNDTKGGLAENAFVREGAQEGAAYMDTFQIRPDILQMVLIMGAPVKTLIYRQGESLPGFSEEYHNGREYFCYIVPNQILVVERDWTRTDMLRMRKMSPAEFDRWEEEREKEATEKESAAGEDSLQNSALITPLL